MFGEAYQDCASAFSWRQTITVRSGTAGRADAMAAASAIVILIFMFLASARVSENGNQELQ